MSKIHGYSIYLIASIALLQAACGGSGSGGASPSGRAVQMTPITSTQQGSQASYGGAQAAQLANAVSTDSLLAVLNGNSTLNSARKAFKSGDPVYDRLSGSLAKLIKFGSVGYARSSQMGFGTLAASTEVILCNSGYYESTVSSTLTSFSLSETYFNCDDGFGAVLNGTLHFGLSLIGLDSMSMTLRFGNGDNILEPTDFTILTSSGGEQLSASTASLTFRVELTIAPGTTENYNLDVNGALQDVYTAASANGSNASQTDTLQYNRYSAQVSWDSLTSIWTQRVNGGISLSRLDNGVSPAVNTAVEIDYHNFEIESQPNLAGNLTLSINGTISINFTPDRCFEGSFAFSTIAPLEIDAATRQTVAGHIIINGAVYVLFNPDGSVSVSMDGGLTYMDYTLIELEGLCLLPQP